MAELASELLFTLLKRQDEDGDADNDAPTDPEVSERISSWALFIQVSLVLLALFCSYYLQLKKIQAIHETVVSIFAGMFVGLIIRLTPGEYLQSLVKFDYQIFFNVLLPPIILNSGYELHQANFFRNIGSILTFAFLGTFISAWTLGIILWFWTLLPFESLNMPFVEALSVGATLSATDPVTILAIFKAYKVDPKLYTIIFGESILNDAVAIVMFETARHFKDHKSPTITSLFSGIGIFLVTFALSLLIGVAVGIFTALLLKHTYMRRFPGIESCFILLVAYASYLFSNGCHMSGIVSLLFCGITLKHYAYYNMSRRTQLTTKYLFQVLAQLSENFIFIYLGLSLFTDKELIFRPLFIIITILGICVARWAAVFPLSKLINSIIRYRSRSPHTSAAQAQEIPHSYQAMLFWAGLRGAVGVALAASFSGDNGNTLRATVLVVVVLTVIVFGGTTARMLEILGIRTGVVDEIDSDDEFDIENSSSAAYARSAGSVPLAQRNTYSSAAAAPRPRPGVEGRRNTSASAQQQREEEDLWDAEDSDASDLPPMPRRAPEDEVVRGDDEVEVGAGGGGGGGGLGGISVGGAVGHLAGILASTQDDQAEWFRKLDEGFIKPTLLLDQRKGAGGGWDGGEGSGGAV